jgi:hypothetical protein
MRVFENSVLRRIFGSKRGKVTRGWRKLHNSLVLFAKYNLSDRVKEDEMGRVCSTNGARGMQIGY